MVGWGHHWWWWHHCNGGVDNVVVGVGVVTVGVRLGCHYGGVGGITGGGGATVMVGSSMWW